jgi:hypothetical protein
MMCEFMLTSQVWESEVSLYVCLRYEVGRKQPRVKSVRREGQKLKSKLKKETRVCPGKLQYHGFKLAYS